jgi:hypothetical protein
MMPRQVDLKLIRAQPGRIDVLAGQAVNFDDFSECLVLLNERTFGLLPPRPIGDIPGSQHPTRLIAGCLQGTIPWQAVYGAAPKKLLGTAPKRLRPGGPQGKSQNSPMSPGCCEPDCTVWCRSQNDKQFRAILGFIAGGCHDTHHP